jgi:hypothetical protein
LSVGVIVGKDAKSDTVTLYTDRRRNQLSARINDGSEREAIEWLTKYW